MRVRPGARSVAPADAASLVEQVRDYAIIALDSSGTIESWNSGAERLKGYLASEIIGRSFTSFYPEDDRRRGVPLQLLDRARREGSVEHTGWRVRKDGTRFWGDVTITALRDDAGELTGYAKVTRDLTEQHELEQSLRRSEERFRLLVGQVADHAIFALDGSGTVESWNVGAERLKGWTAQEAMGLSSAIFYTEADRRAGLPLALLTRARDEGSAEHTGWRVRRDGTLFYAHVVITALRNSADEVTGFAEVTRDLTETRRLEEAQRAFYASFAHDFATPVTALQGYAELLPHADAEEREHCVQQIVLNSTRLAAMMRTLVDHAQQRLVGTPHEPEPLTLDDLDDAVRSRLGPGFDLDRLVVHPSPLMVHADRAALERVLTNVVGNALRYSETGAVDVAASAAGSHVVLSVTDRGRGIDPADLPTIFDEFTRGRMARSDGGSGLGLASARQLVEQQGGRIWLESTPGEGTEVSIELPTAAQAVARLAEPAPTDRLRAG